MRKRTHFKMKNGYNILDILEMNSVEINIFNHQPQPVFNFLRQF